MFSDRFAVKIIEMTPLSTTNISLDQDDSSVVVPIFKSPLRYPGGKQKAISQIFSMFPERADEYREPMIGGGSVYLQARSAGFAETYWINDLFSELVAFWKTVQDFESCSRLMKELEELRCSFDSADQIKDFFLEARSEESVDEYRMAFLFFFFNRVTFSGTTRAGGFSSSASTKRFTASSIERLRRLPTAFSGTKITEVDFQKVIETPGKDVFVFLDPPYYTASKLYGRNGDLHNFDHERLARSLKSSGHRFLITYDDCKEIRDLYSWAKTKCWSLQYGMNNCNAKNTSKIGSELFISNY
jgi:DNA adenine methylase